MPSGDDFNPYQAPASDWSADEGAAAGPGELQLATRGSRLAAALLDGLLQSLVVVPLQLALGVYDGFPKIQPLGLSKTLFWGLAGFTIYLAFNGYFLAKNGQTIGKRLMRIRIGSRADGSTLPLSKLLLLRVVPLQLMALVPVAGGIGSLLDVLFIFRADQRCLHDHLASTVVVKAS